MSGKIGVFDSGFGGLNTLRHLVDALPAYDYVYLGDSARAPYGPRSSEEIRLFATQAVDFLFAEGCELIIFACNTASSDALRYIQQEYLAARYPGKRVLGVLIPLSEAAVAITRSKRIGVLATEGTVRSGAFVREITKLDPSISVVQESAPLLASLVESGDHESEEASALIAGYLQPLIESEIDTLILGCTHYGFIIDDIRKRMGSVVMVISESPAVPEALAKYLERHAEFAQRLSRGATQKFYTTDTNGRFDALGSVFFGAPIVATNVTLP